MRLGILLLAALALACPGPGRPFVRHVAGGGAAQPALVAPPGGRLPVSVRPEHYALELAIDPRQPRFQGTARIRVDLAEATDRIFLHGRGLSVRRVEVWRGEARQVGRWVEVDAEEGLAAVVLPAAVGRGRVTLRIGWDARFDDQLEGLYRLQEGADWYAFTQFEAIWARRAFPCFDEPHLKATFDVTLRVPREVVAVGNTRVVETRNAEDGQRVVRLATTRPLPTYLLAWAVGPLEIVEAPPIPTAAGVVRDPVPLRGIAARGRGARLAFALREAAEILPALEAETGIAYPFDKLDLAALPDLESGAMENAGLVTFQEELLLVDEAATGRTERADVSATIAHELAHQWYGNLVTAAWWDDLWLNESLATWVEMRLTARRHPDWRSELDALDAIHGIMNKDALASARRLRQPIVTDDDIAGAFDWITYLKGAAVLVMLEHWLGPDVVATALRSYLAAHRFGTATSDDLLGALSEAAGRDVATPFRTLLDQPGLPFVEVEPSCEGDRAAVTLRQSPVRPLGSRADTTRLWQVPVCLRYDAGQGAAAPAEHCVLLDRRELRADLPGVRCPRWVMPDAAAAGYYRWSLPAGAARALVEQGLPHLAARERLSAADQLVASVWTGRTPIEDALSLAPAFGHDREPAVARAIHPLAWLVHEHLADAVALPRVRAFVRRLVHPWPSARLVRSAGEPAASAAEVARVELLVWAAEDPVLRAALADRARRWLGGAVDALAPELVPLGLNVASSEGDEALFARLLAGLAASRDAAQREQVLVALGSFVEPELAARARTLELDERLLVGEMGTVLATQLATEETRDAAWAWMKAHWRDLEGRLGPDLAAFWIGHTDVFCSTEAARDVSSFFTPRQARLPGAPRLLANTIESIELCAARVEATRDGARRFFGAR